MDAEPVERLSREWRDLPSDWDTLPDEDYRAKNRFYDRPAAIERQLVATEEGRVFLTSSITDRNEVVRLDAATAILPFGVPQARHELERLRAAGSPRTPQPAVRRREFHHASDRTATAGSQRSGSPDIEVMLEHDPR
jgi:hypothetical protein